jgi:hypothetical protein
VLKFSDKKIEMVMAVEEEAPSQEPIWTGVTIDDLSVVDFEAPVRGTTAADCSELWTSFNDASATSMAANDLPSAKVFKLLGAIVQFHFRPRDMNSPFGPMVVMEGRRSAIPEDFRGFYAEVIAAAAEKSTVPALKARLCDLGWMLNRSRVDLGRAAISAYVDVVEGVKIGLLAFRFKSGTDYTGHRAHGVLQRGLFLASFKSVGTDTEEARRIREFTVSVFQHTCELDSESALHRFSELVFDFELCRAEDVGLAIERWIEKNGNVDEHGQVELYRLAARAYHRANKLEDRNRCKLAMVDTLVRMAEKSLTERQSAIIAASFLSDAISELHGLPDVREKRKALKHRLIDVQAGIPDEFQSFSHEIDVTEIVDRSRKSLENLCLRDMFFVLAGLEYSPSPDKLRADAIRTIQEHPLSSLFGTSFHDREGKVIHRSAGGGLGDASDEELRVSIAQAERIRRQIHAVGQVQPVRRHIVENFYVAEDTFRSLFERSGFVPSNLLVTFSRGFSRFFQGDFFSALYILTPLLENSLRHVLKSYGHDVSAFDNATKTQQDLTISALFMQMRPELDEIFGTPLTTDIDNVFLSKPGPSLRHGVAHGLLNDGETFGSDAIYGCWLIFKLCIIPLYPIRGEIILPE